MAPLRTREDGKRSRSQSLSPVTPKKTYTVKGDDSHTGLSPESSRLNLGSPAHARRPSGSFFKRAKTVVNELPQQGSLGPLANAPSSATRHLFVWGTGDMGQFGLGTETFDEIKRPRVHAVFEEKIEKDPEWKRGIIAAACGGMHSLVIDDDGHAWSWGINDNAALGRKTAGIEGIDPDDLESVPMRVTSLGPVAQVAAGDSISIALTEEGLLRCWGSFRESEGLMGFGSNRGVQFEPVTLPGLARHAVSSVSVGTDHFLALTTDGQVFACGNGEQGQLGRRVLNRHKRDGMRIERLILGKASVKATAIGCGSYHSFAVAINGDVYAWGLNSFRQLGVDTGEAQHVFTPQKITELSPDLHGGARVVQIDAGEHHSLFLFSNGEVWACGRNDSGQLGLAPSSPAVVEMNAIQEAAGAELQKVNAEKQAKRNEIAAQYSAEDPALFEALEHLENAPGSFVMPAKCIPTVSRVDFPEDAARIVYVAAGTQCSYAVSDAGALYAWGEGPSSQLGLGDEEEVSVPTRVASKSLAGHRVLAVYGGGQHALAIAVKEA